MMRKISKSATRYVLEALIPYTEANLKLAFKPGLFFADLEKISSKNNQTIKNAYYKLIRDGIVEIDDDNIPRLTQKGMRDARLYKPEKLKGAELLVIFDIPEEQKYYRQHIRLLLKELKFRQVQKSVWASRFNFREIIQAEIERYDLDSFVIVYEARKL